jgi:hypothetical protein
MIKFVRTNSLSIVFLLLFVFSMAGQYFTGLQEYNKERKENGQSPVPATTYFKSGHFIESTFENWESEFLQMGMYVLLTVRLRQRGSAESRPFDPSQEKPRVEKGRTPWPVRRGGLWKRLYEHSLATAFFALFAMSFGLHALGSWRAKCDEDLLQGMLPPSFPDHLFSSDFWFESMQNWQSEFLAVLAIVVLTIFLRQKDSPQSKPVAAPHSQTGD